MRERTINRRPQHETRTRIVSLLLLVWLAIGLIAAGQRHYFDSGPLNCAGYGTVAVTAVAGPLNYMGVNPKISVCQLPQPSQ